MKKFFCFLSILVIIGVMMAMLSIKEKNQNYFLFKEIYFDIRTDIYNTRDLDEEDKSILPKILEQYGYIYRIQDNEIYIEKELFDDKEMMQKITGDLHAKRGQKYWGFED